MIKYERIGNIGVLTLSRPWVRNAINTDMMNQLNHYITVIENDKNVKCVVLTGEGDTFCSGGDIEEFHQMNKDATTAMLHKMKDVLYRLQTLRKPTVAALNGTAVGGGCEIATACDFRVAHPHLKIGFIQINLAITTGWGGATRLFTIIPRSKALQLLLSGEKLESYEAHKLGFIDSIFPEQDFINHVLEWCQQFTKHSVEAIMSYKETITAFEHDKVDMKTLLSQEVYRSARLWKTEAHEEAVNRFLLRNENPKSNK